MVRYECSCGGAADLLFTEIPRQQWWFLQDNAPSHRANVTQTWLHNHGVSCIDFPPYSPDLNCIENVWQDLERRVEAQAPDKDELQDVIAEEWPNTQRDFLVKLVHSMPKRCEAVIAAKGDHIHF